MLILSVWALLATASNSFSSFVAGKEKKKQSKNWLAEDWNSGNLFVNGVNTDENMIDQVLIRWYASVLIYVDKALKKLLVFFFLFFCNWKFKIMESER